MQEAWRSSPWLKSVRHSGKGGQGVVVARTGNGWSGPSFIGTGGAGWGPQIGAQITEFVSFSTPTRR